MYSISQEDEPHNMRWSRRPPLCFNEVALPAGVSVGQVSLARGGGWARLSLAVRVRREVAQVFVATEYREATHCSANGILPRHASLVTVGCEALGTSVSRILRDGNRTVRGCYDC